MDDFVGDPQPFVRIVLPGLVGHGNRSLHAPAETEGFSESNLQASMAEPVVVIADRADQSALVSLLKAFRHFLCAPETAPVVALGVVQGALEGVGVHGGRWNVGILWGLAQGPWHQKARPGGRAVN